MGGVIGIGIGMLCKCKGDKLLWYRYRGALTIDRIRSASRSRGSSLPTVIACSMNQRIYLHFHFPFSILISVPYAHKLDPYIHRSIHTSIPTYTRSEKPFTYNQTDLMTLYCFSISSHNILNLRSGIRSDRSDASRAEQSREGVGRAEQA